MIIRTGYKVTRFNHESDGNYVYRGIRIQRNDRERSNRGQWNTYENIALSDGTYARMLAKTRKEMLAKLDAYIAEKKK